MLSRRQLQGFVSWRCEEQIALVTKRATVAPAND
jgi:hypothetical protein